MILQTPDPRTLREALPDFSRATHVFLPINDCRNVSQAEGGTHWSLLLISVVDRIAFHYDSLYQGNVWEADVVTRKFGYLLNMPIRFMHLNDSPQQDGGSDCGVFVCMNMRHLLMKRLLMASAHEKVSMSLGGRKVDAHGSRKEMAKIIEGFRKEGERRRSYVITWNRLDSEPKLTFMLQDQCQSNGQEVEESSASGLSSDYLTILRPVYGLSRFPYCIHTFTRQKQNTFYGNISMFSAALQWNDV